MPSRQGGFTLIELLIAMTVLAILVMTVGTVMLRSSDLWASGQAEVETAENARNALQLIRNYAQAALVNDYLPLYMEQDEYSPSGLSDNSSIFFLSNQAQYSQGGRTDWREVSFFVVTTNETTGRGMLVRRMEVVSTATSNYVHDTINTSDKVRSLINTYRTDRDNCEVLAENVYEFFIHWETADVDPVFYSNRVPRNIEISLLVLDDLQWRTMGVMRQLGGDRADDYARKNGKKFTTRLTFPQAQSL